MIPMPFQRRALFPAALVLGFTFLSACADDPPATVWDDLGGTIYYLGGTFQDSIRKVDPRTGVTEIIPGAPLAQYLAAAPTGDWLLYTWGGVFRYDLRTGAVSVIAPDILGSFATGGSVSPDGLRVVYERSTSDGRAIMRQDVTGANLRELVGPGRPGLQQPAWVDSERIVFLYQPDGLYRLWAVQADGSGLGYFASDTGLAVGGVAAAPQVERLVIVRRPTGAPPSELWELDFEGQMRHLVTVDGLYPSFAWSPDGQYLVYCQATATSVADLIVLHAASGQTKQLTTDPAYECHPAWGR